MQQRFFTHTHARGFYYCLRDHDTNSQAMVIKSGSIYVVVTVAIMNKSNVMSMLHSLVSGFNTE